MTDDERRAHVIELRTLRTSPQALGRMLRKEASVEEGKEPMEKRKSVDESAQELYKELGL